MSSLLSLLALAVVAAPAPPGPDDLTYIARSNIVTTLDPSLAIYGAPRGIGYDGVAGLLITKPTGTFLCTGSLVGGTRKNVVTAAHCLLGATSVDAVFFPPSGGTVVVTSMDYTIRPGYTGAVIDENDIGVVHLGMQVAEVESYELFSSDAVGRDFTEIGFGRSGTGTTGSVLPAGTRRRGYNTFDFRADDPIFDLPTGPFFGDQNILFADFDNGTVAQDASCGLTAFFTATNAAYCHLGRGNRETMSAPGDSGGPLFVHGRLAAVASFGITFFDGDGNPLWDIDNALNSTFGELGGYVPISAHAAWLRGQTVPEPATILLMLTGLAGIAVARRRRRGEDDA